MNYIQISGIDKNKNIKQNIKIIPYLIEDKLLLMYNVLLKNKNILFNKDIYIKYINLLFDNYKKYINNNILNIDNFYINKRKKEILFIKYNNFSKKEINIINKYHNKYKINIILCTKKLFNKYVSVCKFIISEIENFNWYICKDFDINNIYIYTGNNKFSIIKTFDIYTIQYKNEIKNVYISYYIENNIIKDILNLFICDFKIQILFNILKNSNSLKKCKSINANCNKSMYLLDSIHRSFINNLNLNNFNNNNIAINSVAGSGKTTTLINIAQNNKNDKILYTAFNKKLIEELKIKKNKIKLNNLYVYTFDALMRNIYLNIYNINDINLCFLKPNNIHTVYETLKHKNYFYKKKILYIFEKFLEQYKYNNVKDFINNLEDKDKYNNCIYIIEKLWNDILNHKFQTFLSIRKLVFHNLLSIDYINNNYKAILIDEAQDFDDLMLQFLLKTKLCKIFVGDDKQAIYDWRGCINAFNKLPNNTLFINYYSTFRISQDACNYISKKIKDLFIFSNSNNNTEIINSNNNFNNSKKSYIYLCRSWKTILQLAQYIPDIYINDYCSKKKYIEQYYNNKFKKNIDILDEYEDDLPKFLLSKTKYEIKTLLDNIENNLVIEDKAICKFYTIHSYKGLESNYIILADDIKVREEQNLYYVALTRGIIQTLDNN